MAHADEQRVAYSQTTSAGTDLRGYPFAIPDELLEEMLKTAITRVPSKDLSSAPPDSLAWLIDAGLQELQRRRLDRVVAGAERSRRQASRLGRLSLGIAICLGAITAIFGTLDYYGDQGWRGDQKEILTEIRDRLPP